MFTRTHFFATVAFAGALCATESAIAQDSTEQKLQEMESTIARLRAELKGLRTEKGPLVAAPFDNTLPAPSVPPNNDFNAETPHSSAELRAPYPADRPRDYYQGEYDYRPPQTFNYGYRPPLPEVVVILVPPPCPYGYGYGYGSHGFGPYSGGIGGLRIDLGPLYFEWFDTGR